MDAAIRDFPPGDLRVSDADRDRALSELSGAFEAGRITADEFGQRSGQALRARTGKELSSLLADLPPDGVRPAHRAARESTVPPARRCAPDRACRRAVATRIAMGASAAAAVSLAATAAANGLSSGGGISPQNQAVGETAARQALSAAASALNGGAESAPRQLLETLARKGVPVPAAAPGFDWAGTVIPAAFAVLLVALVIVLRVTRAARP